MKKEDKYPIFDDIPEIFWSDLEQKPFQNCINCQSELFHGNVPYMIEKAVRGFDGEKIKVTIFEYAVCVSCAAQMQLKLSLESRTNITAFFNSNVDFTQRLKDLEDAPRAAWLGKCLLRNEPIDEKEEYQLYALCHGNQIIYKEYPYLISGKAIDKMIDLISAKTMEQLDKFKDDLFGGPPELKELFDKAGPRILL